MHHYIELEAEGQTQSVSGFFSLWQEDNCIDSGELNSLGLLQRSIVVAPGTYFYNGSVTLSGGDGSTSYGRAVRAACCGNDFGITVSSSGAGAGAGTTDVTAFLTVFEDGTCDTGSPDAVPINVCDA